MKLDDNRGLAQVGSHGEIGNGSNHGDGGGDVVEDPVRSGFGEGHADEHEGRGGHEGANCPVQVRAMSGNLKGRTATDALCVHPVSEISRMSLWRVIRFTTSALLPIFLPLMPGCIQPQAARCNISRIRTGMILRSRVWYKVKVGSCGQDAQALYASVLYHNGYLNPLPTVRTGHRGLTSHPSHLSASQLKRPRLRSLGPGHQCRRRGHFKKRT